jgi:hypothetical protein
MQRAFFVLMVNVCCSGKLSVAGGIYSLYSRFCALILIFYPDQIAAGTYAVATFRSLPLFKLLAFYGARSVNHQSAHRSAFGRAYLYEIYSFMQLRH